MELVDETLSEVQPFLPETDWGSIEYKRKLVGITPHRRSQLITQMKWRLSEGKGSAEYNIGVDDNGTPNPLTSEQYSESLETILGIAKDAGADVKKLHIRRYQSGIIFTLRIQLRSSDLDEYRWLIIGCTGVGKTTLAGCLLDNVVDDGKGSVRNRKLRHLHELDTGSSTQPLFSYKELEDCMLVLIDLPGGEKYLEDMIVRTLAYRPTGVIYVERPGQSHENPFKKLSVAIAQSGVPVLTAIMGLSESNSSSHIICQTNVIKGCNSLLSRIMDISKHAREPAWKDTFPSVCVIICETMDSLELGLVAHGVVLSGSVRVGDCLQLSGTNIKVTINSVHRYKKPIACVDEDTSASFTFENNITNLSRLLHRGLLVTPGEVIKQINHKKYVYSANGFSMTSWIKPILNKDLEYNVSGEPHAPLPTSPETGIE